MDRVGAGRTAQSWLPGARRRVTLLGCIAAAWLALALGGSASALAATGAISGTVTAAETRAPLGGIEVCAISITWLESETTAEAPEPGSEQLGCVETAADGEYVVTGLGAGTFLVAFGDPPFGSLDFLTQFYNGKGTLEEASTVTVKGGTTTSEIDAALQEGAELSGTVTNSATAGAVEGALVCAFPSSEAGAGEGACARTGAGGSYEVVGLAAGSYRVVAFARGLGLSFFGGSSPGEATAVLLAGREQRSGINIAMRPLPTSSEGGASGPTPAGAVQPPGGPSPSESAPALGGGAPSSGVALANSFVREHPHNSVLVRLTCKSATKCRGRVALTVIRVVRHAGRSRHETVTIGSARFTAKAGQTFSVRVAIDGAGRSLLGAARGHLAARLRIVQSTPSPTRTTVKRVLLLRRRGAKRRA